MILVSEHTGMKPNSPCYWCMGFLKTRTGITHRHPLVPRAVQIDDMRHFMIRRGGYSEYYERGLLCSQTTLGYGDLCENYNSAAMHKYRIKVPEY